MVLNWHSGILLPQSVLLLVCHFLRRYLTRNRPKNSQETAHGDGHERPVFALATVEHRAVDFGMVLQVVLWQIQSWRGNETIQELEAWELPTQGG